MLLKLIDEKTEVLAVSLAANILETVRRKRKILKKALNIGI